MERTLVFGLKVSNNSGSLQNLSTSRWFNDTLIVVIGEVLSVFVDVSEPPLYHKRQNDNTGLSMRQRGVDGQPSFGGLNALQNFKLVG